MTDNPLLELNGLPRFSAIRAEQVEPALDRMLAQNRTALEGLFANNTPYTWENIVQPIEELSERLNRLWSPVSH